MWGDLSMDVFELHRRLISDYGAYTRSFIRISDERIRAKVLDEIERGLLWPDPLLQLNPSFEPGASIDALVSEGVLHEDCQRIFRIKRHENDFGKALRLHLHQEQAIRVANQKVPYVLTTGTGSGKSLTYIVPIVDHVLRHGSGTGIKGIVVYPMNALANSQVEELDKFLKRGFSDREVPVTYARYTGQEGNQERERILKQPPDILLTNYVMLELILTRIDERALVQHASGLRFLVFDELHTYRGRQGSDVAMLIRRCREAFRSQALQCVGTSATMVSVGTSIEQAQVVADVASTIFGQKVRPEHVIGETIRRTTKEYDFARDEVRLRLAALIQSGAEPPSAFEEICVDPLAAWIEGNFGIRREEGTGRLVRQTPQPLEGEHGVAALLAKVTGRSESESRSAIERYLYAGSRCENPETGFPVFAFRLHQFITRGDTAWATLEPEAEREIALRGQHYVPGDRSRILLPLVFCRACGHPYYRVDRPRGGQTGPVVPRESYGSSVSEDVESGYLYLSSEYPWTGETEDVLSRIPEDWIEIHRGQPRIKRHVQEHVPEVMRIRPDGVQDATGVAVAFIPAPFRFCLNPACKVAYSARQRSDVTKLATIGVDGRSTATTVLALTAMLTLRVDPALEPEAKKLLSFTDNRQDASLQAGHFNDFVEVGLIRSALYRALSRAGEGGLRYDELTHHVERALDLPAEVYANDPELRGPALQETRRALRSVLTYFLYRDLERGWRVTSPNLEECGLLCFEYDGVKDAAEDQEFWNGRGAHPALVAASAEQRVQVIRVLLDHLRRSLAVKEDALSPEYQDRISEQSRQRLADSWVIEDPRDMVRAVIAWPRSRMEQDRGEQDLCISAQSNFGLFLRRAAILPSVSGNLGLDDTRQIIVDLFRCLRVWGLVEEVRTAREGSDVAGYQLPASVMIWRAGEGSRPLVDPLRVTRASEFLNLVNEYFVAFYRKFAELGVDLEAREHTAQVQSDVRMEREEAFRKAELPILFCSPTMELGVDIAQLNVVNMRNVPPTPANYAQRSGRAGRSGQPALVYTYCSGFSPHDQFYFRNPERMVMGTVSAPRLDLLNRDLVQAHVHAVWLSEAAFSLGQTLTDVLSVSEEELALPVQENIRFKLNDAAVRLRALQRARRLLESIGPDLDKAGWYRPDWLDDVLARVPQSFDEACNRWRSLYRAAVQQRALQNRVIGDHSRTSIDRDRAKRLRAQAESQIALLTDPQNSFEGDFYSYRYFASEGFLPGYNFPRLPLSAFIPARRGRLGRDEFLSRPRFLAIAEFGPRALIYHEGSRYRVHKVNLAFDEHTSELTRFMMKVCSECGYGHLVYEGAGPDVCDSCRHPLRPTDEIREMVRLQNVTAKRADRITSDEEERQRIGYELRTSFHFSDLDGNLDFRRSEVVVGERRIATLKYGDAATIWRVNLGWRKRRNLNEHGFLLDVERGFWATNRDADEGDREEPLSGQVRRVVPYVEDRRNALTIEFDVRHDQAVMATLQSAIKQAIQKIYQLEPEELAAEPLPNADDRRLLFFYEAAEGGAGILRQIAEEPGALAEIARTAMQLCHYDPDSGDDVSEQEGTCISCEAACYDCLLEYGNQPDHRIIDRKKIPDVLRELMSSVTEASAGPTGRVDHVDLLMRSCDSELERKWLKRLHEARLRLPSHGQYLIASCDTRPDFFYQDANTAIYIDGPVHDTPEQQKEDREITNRLTEAGYLVIRFHHAAGWDTIVANYPDIFGRSAV